MGLKLGVPEHLGYDGAPRLPYSYGIPRSSDLALLFFPVNSAAADHCPRHDLPQWRHLYPGDAGPRAGDRRPRWSHCRHRFERRNPQAEGRHTQVVDLGGHFVMPGFNDAHLHLQPAGFEQLNVNLVGAKSLPEMQQRIAEHAKTTAPGDWIVGDGWDHTLWPEQTLPTRQDMDAVTNGHPAIFVRVDGHIAIANSAALQAAGITARPRAPRAARLITTPGAAHGHYSRSPAKGWCLPKFQRPRWRSGATQRNWRWPMPRVGASRRRRTIPTGRFSGLRRYGARRQADAAHQRVAATSTIRSRCWRSIARTIPPTIRCCTPPC